MLLAASKTPLTDFLLQGGGAVAGGGAFGVLLATLSWIFCASILRLVGLFTGGDYATASIAGLDKFAIAGGSLGGLVGFLIFAYEHYEVF